MRSSRPIFTLLTVTLTFCLVLTPALLAESKDERAIRILIDRYKQAANSTDTAFVKRLLSELSPAGGPFYTPYGNALTSVTDFKDQIEHDLQPLASRRFSIPTPFTIQVDDKMAWTSFNWTMDTVHKDGGQHSLRGRDTLVFAKPGKNWKLRHIHSSLPAHVPPNQAAIQVDANSILDQERARWAALKDQQMDAVGINLDDNYSTLQDGQAYRIQGKSTYLSSAKDWASQNKLRSFQILDPKLEVLGDTALLTYYYASSGTSTDGSFSHSGKATSVYVRKDGKWLAFHHHNTLNKKDPMTQERKVD
jgi:ketosteroid isomerase-like protein